MNQDAGNTTRLSLEDALARLRETIDPVQETETVDLADAVDRVLATPVVSPLAMPVADNSAMDGYALRFAELAEDSDSEFGVAGTAFAGRPWTGTAQPGQCVRIMTGAVLPRDLDTVVIQEDVTRIDDREAPRIRVGPGHAAGQNVRRAGEEFAAGETLLDAGRRLAPCDIALVAALGIPEVGVRRRVRVGLFTTGDELVEPGLPLGAGQIYNSNRHLLGAALARTGATVTDYGNLGDDPAALREVLRDAAQSCDLVITSGGVSVGEADFVHQVVGEIGAVEFWKLRMKPGKPLLFGGIGSCRMLGLPGNPVSAAVTFAIVARPLLALLAGEATHAPPYLRACVAEPMRKSRGRRDFQRGILEPGPDGDYRVRPAGPQGSHRLTSLTRANCLVDLAEERGDVAPGESVDCIPLSALF